MLLHWSKDTQATLNPLRIVVVDITYNHLNQSLLIGKPPAIIAFPFEDAPEALHGAVINTMGYTRHTLEHSSLFQLAMKFSAGILEPPVAVEQRLGTRICPHGLIKRLIHKRIIIAFADGISDNAPVTKIKDGTEIDFVYGKSFVPFKFCDVCTPFLVWSVGMKLSI